MAKDLTNSNIDRQNILNNEIALTEIQKRSDFNGLLFENKYIFTKDMISKYFEVDTRTIERYTSDFAPDINVGCKIRQLAIFDFKAFLNIAMLLSESVKAKSLRQANLVVNYFL